MNWWDVLWILFIVIPLIMLWGFALVDLFGRHDIGGWAKAAWLFAIIFFPVLGTLLYVIFRPRYIDESYFDRRSANQVAGQWDERMAPTSASRAEQLSVLSQLHDSGKLTDQEYTAEKGRVLGSA